MVGPAQAKGVANVVWPKRSDGNYVCTLGLPWRLVFLIVYRHHQTNVAQGALVAIGSPHNSLECAVSEQTGVLIHFVWPTEEVKR